MTQYKSVNVNLSDNQINKLRQAINANCAATSIKLGYDDLDGDHTIFITNGQYNKLQNARDRGKGLTIRMSSKQLKHNTKTQGGFFGGHTSRFGSRCKGSGSRINGCRKKGTSTFGNRCPFRFSVHRSK